MILEPCCQMVYIWDCLLSLDVPILLSGIYSFFLLTSPVG